MAHVNPMDQSILVRLGNLDAPSTAPSQLKVWCQILWIRWLHVLPNFSCKCFTSTTCMWERWRQNIASYIFFRVFNICDLWYGCHECIVWHLCKLCECDPYYSIFLEQNKISLTSINGTDRKYKDPWIWTRNPTL